MSNVLIKQTMKIGIQYGEGMLHNWMESCSHVQEHAWVMLLNVSLLHACSSQRAPYDLLSKQNSGHTFKVNDTH